MSKELIRLQDLTMEFDGERILDGINLYFNDHEFLTLLGPSGCGKTTTLRIIGGFLTPTSGKVIFDGKVVNDLPPYQRQVNTVFQRYALFPHLDVYDNVAFGLKVAKVPKDEIRQRVTEILETVSLKGYENRRVDSLSGGQQQRVALARSIVTHPKVLLLDEPLSAIDAKLRKALQTRIREIHQELGLTTVFVTHDQDEAMVMSDVIELFHDGRIEQSGSPVSVYTSPVSTFAASFIGSYNQIPGGQFAALTGDSFDDACTVAIRPETITLTRRCPKNPDAYTLNGTVLGSTPRGNVLRYSIQVGQVKFHVDALFRSFHIFAPGETLYLSIPKHDCLCISDKEVHANAV